MRIGILGPTLCLVALCAVAASCAPASSPSNGPGGAVAGSGVAASIGTSATQTIRGVTVAVETTLTQASETPYSLSNVLVRAKPGYWLFSVSGMATNSTDESVTVSNAPVTVLDSSGTVLPGFGGMRVVLPASGPMDQSILVGHRYVPVPSVGPSGRVYYIASYQLPIGSSGPVTVRWALGGDRTYTFRLQTPP